MAQISLKKNKTAVSGKLEKIQGYGTGRRKTAIARVYLRSGKGKITVNKKTLEQYFGRETSRMLVHQPLEAIQAVGKYDIEVTVRGGGSNGQAGAIRLGIARALVKHDEADAPKEGVIVEIGSESSENKPLSVRKTLRQAKLLTRDPRVVERKKVGRRKARKSKQFSKR